MTDNEKWRKKLTDNEFHICREKGTEPAFTGEFWDKKDSGSYVCKCCGEKLFDSDGKYDSGCGWPSFFQPVDHELIRTAVDNSLSRVRTEIMCEKCGSHLGHVFDDGPEITGQRYCVNSASLNFKGK
ncbi:MAG: peptide-methionine (R)-S-oxide reductase MsrB [Gammaproteobacteria bacterium]|jgi:peptide-methionine (R)-S-oxide reductase|nr:peptide-methionine (R)-S-oxide reductase MsrB [Gammaproteobacteria bacterium]MBT3724847.1 peptide-methionine (R)-S-oxide reductase MsrB [Gammaproteobacteria bacterium]MBT4076027.1 peptide-methionine (R)-S-oxide reductase MsrB [Gammaproteobacteria bacterium]MBT4192705.1 peptide-methionine (R)-S-oxide reductase MsrB [Gammaproteobacteria bacterium]MBT4451714.1 peptide-methionine (R)-S-oxide reductase MsrB [Gammaproteobacteria bacterium]